MSVFSSTKAVDAVGIFDSSFNQVFAGARPLKASVKPTAQFFKHPLENSTNRIDHVIFDPVEVSFSLMISGANYKSIYQQIKQAFTGQEQLVVQTKTDTYENMYLQEIPHEESPENYDSILMALKLKETKLANAGSSFSPAHAKNSNTADRGQVESVAANTTQQGRGSVLSRWMA